MSDMLEVTTGKLRDPVVVFVKMETGNGLFHIVSSRPFYATPRR